MLLVRLLQRHGANNAGDTCGKGPGIAHELVALGQAEPIGWQLSTEERLRICGERERRRKEAERQLLEDGLVVNGDMLPPDEPETVEAPGDVLEKIARATLRLRLLNGGGSTPTPSRERWRRQAW